MELDSYRLIEKYDSGGMWNPIPGDFNEWITEYKTNQYLNWATNLVLSGSFPTVTDFFSNSDATLTATPRQAITIQI